MRQGAAPALRDGAPDSPRGDSYVYAYRGPSVLSAERGLDLRTSGGRARSGETTAPHFFTGFAVRPGVVAAGLLAVAAVARSRYFQPSTVAVRDPVMTCDGSLLRCESFSDCCGVYARLDLLPSILDGAMPDRGTTNVDVNEPLRWALARVPDTGLLHLAVGAHELAVTTGDGGVVERKVPMPQRWLRGFAEAQVISSGFDLRAELGSGEAARFISAPVGRDDVRGSSWLVPAAGGLRRSSRPVSGAMCLAGVRRLEALRPLVRYASSLRVYGPAVSPGSGPVASAWELVLPGARLVLTVSPEVRRGFSGEGAVLSALAAGPVEHDAELVAVVLGDDDSIEPDLVAERTGLPPDRVRAALVRLGVDGRVGYDLAQARYFARELPFRSGTAEADNPRLGAARDLVARGAVRLGDGPEPVATVTVGDHVQRVRRHAGGYGCTCQWYAAHGSGRGPCKHILAVGIAERAASGGGLNVGPAAGDDPLASGDVGGADGARGEGRGDW